MLDLPNIVQRFLQAESILLGRDKFAKYDYAERQLRAASVVKSVNDQISLFIVEKNRLVRSFVPADADAAERELQFLLSGIVEFERQLLRVFNSCRVKKAGVVPAVSAYLARMRRLIVQERQLLDQEGRVIPSLKSLIGTAENLKAIGGVPDARTVELLGGIRSFGSGIVASCNQMLNVIHEEMRVSVEVKSGLNDARSYVWLQQQACKVIGVLLNKFNEVVIVWSEEHLRVVGDFMLHASDVQREMMIRLNVLLDELRKPSPESIEVIERNLEDALRLLMK